MTSKQQNARVEIYTWRTCGYCLRAKHLLEDKNVDFIEYAIDGDDEAHQRMIERADGRRSMPQIFINDLGVGGFFELLQLEQEGRLEGLMNDQPGSYHI